MPQALFYPVSFQRDELLQLFQEVVRPVDVVAFDEEDGGTAERELAIPYLPGMDEVQVESARFSLQPQEKLLETTGYTVSKTSGNDAGVFLSFPVESRLKKLTLGYPQFPAAVRNESDRYTYLNGAIQSRADGNAKPLHLVIRPATGEGQPFGPPIFADPPFTLGPLYGPILGGLSVSDLGGSHFQVTFPKTRGEGFLIQLAHGDSADALVPVDLDMPIQQVVVDAAVRDLSITLAAGENPVTVWSHPGALLPETGSQDVDFTPLAGRELQRVLGTMGRSAMELTLPLRLSFRSRSAGAVALSDLTVDAHYVVKPLGSTPTTIHLDGGWQPLRLEAPAARRPETNSVRARLLPLGQELNAGSDLPPLVLPTRGLRVSSQRWLAGRLIFLPASSSSPGTMLPLASVRVCIASPVETEVVLEVRADVGGTPGASLTSPLVKKVDPGFTGWLHLFLPESLPLITGLPIWTVLRANQGEVQWFTGEEGTAKMSLDRGGSWGEVETKLAPIARPLVQLFHEVPNPQPLPVIQARIDQAVVETGLFRSAGRLSDREFLSIGPALSSAVLDRLASTSGGARSSTELQLFSRSMMTLVVEELILSYDPFRS